MKLLLLLTLIAFASCKTEKTIRATHNIQGTSIDSFKAWSTVSNDSGYLLQYSTDSAHWGTLSASKTYYRMKADNYTRNSPIWDAVWNVLIALTIIAVVLLIAYAKAIKESNNK